MPKVLVADDSITIRKVAERLLTEAGLEVALAANGEEAIGYLEKEQPDCIICDVIMPDKSGYDVCQFVRAHGTLFTIPVLLISGVVNDEVTRKAQIYKADGVLKKPFQGSSLTQRVLELLAKRQLQPPDTSQAAQIPAMPVSLTQEVGPAAHSSPAVPKAYRISEDQLQMFRQTVRRVKELEDSLAAERARAAELAEEAESSRQLSRRIGELEAAMAEMRTQARELTQQLDRLVELERRVQGLEASLAGQQARGLQLAEQLSRLEEADYRIRELEALLAAQQTRAGELAHHFNRLAGLEARTKDFEQILIEERKRNDQLILRVGVLEQELHAVVDRLGALTGFLEQFSGGSIDVSVTAKPTAPATPSGRPDELQYYAR